MDPPHSCLIREVSKTYKKTNGTMADMHIYMNGTIADMHKIM